MKTRILSVAFVCSLFLAAAAQAREPGWYGKVVTYGAEHERIEQTPILLRPYRPFHFYGNTVRRMHYRGTAAPDLRDLRNGTAALLLRQ